MTKPLEALFIGRDACVSIAMATIGSHRDLYRVYTSADRLERRAVLVLVNAANANLVAIQRNAVESETTLVVCGAL